jgi:hypothetical protein
MCKSQFRKGLQNFLLGIVTGLCDESNLLTIRYLDAFSGILTRAAIRLAAEQKNVESSGPQSFPQATELYAPLCDVT